MGVFTLSSERAEAWSSLCFVIPWGGDSVLGGGGGGGGGMECLKLISGFAVLRMGLGLW